MDKSDLVKLATEQIGYLEKSRADYELYGSDCLYPKTKYAEHGAILFTSTCYPILNGYYVHGAEESAEE